MPTVIPNKFTAITFTKEEMELIEKMDPLYRLFLMNMRSEIAMRKLDVKVNLDKPLDAAVDIWFFTAQIDLLDQLIGDQNGRTD